MEKSTIFKNTDSSQRKQLYAQAFKIYADKIKDINDAEGKNIFDIVDFNFLKELRDKIANDGYIGDNKDHRAFYCTAVQKYMVLLYAIYKGEQENVVEFTKRPWRQFLKVLFSEKLITDATYVRPFCSRPEAKIIAAKEKSKKSKNTKNVDGNLDITKICEYIKQTGLIYDDSLIKRYVAALQTKPFVILSGLSGSGKTQLALAFAHVICDDLSEQLCFVSVGADWTNREPLLGYPNALKKDQYEKPENGVLDIILRAAENEDKPYFLVLDEMNLSYVERYFADFLSTMESDTEIAFWTVPDKDVPMSIKLPKNLFIIGTINVDETTYMFSPKVLDRANVIEFKVTEEDMKTYLENHIAVDIEESDSMAADMASCFVEVAKDKITQPDAKIAKVLLDFFKTLKNVNAEFGYRTANEIYRFIGFAKNLGLTDAEAIDAAIIQKLLPKLHGSRKHLNEPLKKLWELCLNQDVNLPLTEDCVADSKTCKYLLSADKILRMYKAAVNNGFTSFAEA